MSKNNGKSYTLFTDGGSRGNPGPAAAGVVIKDPKGKNLKKAGKYLGIKTNNEAEYQALILGMKAAILEEIKELTCILDSELIVKQLNGLYKVKSANLKKYFKTIREMEKNFISIEYNHVKRQKNKEADEMVNHILDDIDKRNEPKK